mmetsp:Transcript_255/g.344  ORF Transcript_255/g.344 Transcript_255/m.344 type:complete len:258 (+) Transcript_255:1171-1944(+)
MLESLLRALSEINYLWYSLSICSLQVVRVHWHGRHCHCLCILCIIQFFPVLLLLLLIPFFVVICKLDVWLLFFFRHPTPHPSYFLCHFSKIKLGVTWRHLGSLFDDEKKVCRERVLRCFRVLNLLSSLFSMHSSTSILFPHFRFRRHVHCLSKTMSRHLTRQYWLRKLTNRLIRRPTHRTGHHCPRNLAVVCIIRRVWHLHGQIKASTGLCTVFLYSMPDLAVSRISKKCIFLSREGRSCAGCGRCPRWLRRSMVLL